MFHVFKGSYIDPKGTEFSLSHFWGIVSNARVYLFTLACRVYL